MCPGTVDQESLWRFLDGEFPSLLCPQLVAILQPLDDRDAPVKRVKLYSESIKGLIFY